MEDHHIAAHHVARHLRAIATLLPRLSAQAADPLYDVLFPNGFIDQRDALQDAAVKIETTAPFEPISEEQKAILLYSIGEQLVDRSGREILEDHIADWTEADFRAEYTDEEG